MQDFDDRLRAAAMAWLDKRRAAELPFVRQVELAEFRLEGERIALMDRQRGIRKPARLEAALSMRTTFTPPGQEPPYADTEGPDGCSATSTAAMIPTITRTWRCGQPWSSASR